MLYYKLVVFLAVLTFGLSANPQRCCLPNQFTSTLTTTVTETHDDYVLITYVSHITFF